MAEKVLIDIPCDVQQIGPEGLPWAFLDEAREPGVIYVDAIVVTGDAADPVLARVHSMLPHSSGVVVSLDLLPGDPRDYADAVDRARLSPA